MKKLLKFVGLGYISGGLLFFLFNPGSSSELLVLSMIVVALMLFFREIEKF